MTETLSGGQDQLAINYNARMTAGTPPRQPRVFLPRPLLWDRLDQAAAGAVTVLSAPVGAGKTLGVAGWVRDRFTVVDRPMAGRVDATTGSVAGAVYWIDADGSWDPARLRRMLDVAVRPDEVPIGEEHSTAAGSQEACQQQLLVIDDAHRLPAQTLRMLETRLNQDPTSLRVLMLSRWDLLLTNVVPQLLGDLTVIRGDVLRLSEAEAATLISQHSRISDPDLVGSIATRADGWCAAVVLAARAIGASSDPAAAATRFARGDARFADRIASDVLAALTRRERHLLLSVASEGRTTAEVARQLSRDPGAADLLAGLAATGLLVTRVSESTTPSTTETAADDLDDEDSAAVYRIHPLLSEVIRRRLAAGGVDVEQARATVTRAVKLDLARGQTDRAFDRLFAMSRTAEAAELLATTGVTMVSCGQQANMYRFVRAHLDLVDRDPTVWFPIAVERWVAGDHNAARHWLERLRSCTEPQVGSLVIAAAALLRAKLGLEPVQSAVDQAQRMVGSSTPIEYGPQPSDKAVLPTLLILLGALQNWLGDLGDAEVNLTTAITLSRDRRLPTLEAKATSHLALTQLMAGREHVCQRLSVQALDLLPEIPPSLREPILERASAASLLARFVDLPLIAGVDECWLDLRRASRGQIDHRSDPCTRFWLHILDARVVALQDSPSAAEDALSAPFAQRVAGELPGHLRVVQLLEHSAYAALTGNGDALAQTENTLRDLGLEGEATLIAGWRADLSGDRRAAAEFFGVAASTMHFGQSIYRPLALTCQAQLLDALGERDRALELLLSATAATAARRNAFPFLGWTRQGTPVRTLFDVLCKRVDSGWVQEIAESRRDRADLTSAMASLIATPRERDSTSEMVVQPILSPRERDVLRELARGSTYADIGADLFVSENTVKTHVSHLYAKLGATRRSEALAVARGLRLI